MYAYVKKSSPGSTQLPTSRHLLSPETWFYTYAYVKKSSPGSTQLPTIARNVTGWPANRQAKIFMKIELNSIKNRLSTSFARRAIAIPLASLCKTMEQDVAIDGESELKENRSLSLLVKAEKKSRHKEYSHGTVGSMSTVTQDLHGGRNALSAGDTRLSDIDSNDKCESDLKKNRLLQLFVKSEKQFCSQKLLLRCSRALVDLQDTHVDGVRSSLAGARKDQV